MSSSCNVSITVWSISVTRLWKGNMLFSSIVTQARKSYGTWWVCSLDRLLLDSRVCSFSHQNFTQNIALYFSTNKVDKKLNLFMSTPNTKNKKISQWQKSNAFLFEMKIATKIKFLLAEQPFNKKVVLSLNHSINNGNDKCMEEKR